MGPRYAHCSKPISRLAPQMQFRPSACLSTALRSECSCFYVWLSAHVLECASAPPNSEIRARLRPQDPRKWDALG